MGSSTRKVEMIATTREMAEAVDRVETSLTGQPSLGARRAE